MPWLLVLSRHGLAMKEQHFVIHIGKPPLLLKVNGGDLDPYY
jgi:hypothetical protein